MWQKKVNEVFTAFPPVQRTVSLAENSVGVTGPTGPLRHASSFFLWPLSWEFVLEGLFSCIYFSWNTYFSVSLLASQSVSLLLKLMCLQNPLISLWFSKVLASLHGVSLAFPLASLYIGYTGPGIFYTETAKVAKAYVQDTASPKTHAQHGS